MESRCSIHNSFLMFHIYKVIGTSMSEDGAKRAKSRGFKFDQSLGELEALVEQLESGELGLEEALKLFEKGVKLTRNCQQALDNAQQKVETLIAQSGLGLNEETAGDLSDESDAEDGAEAGHFDE